MAALGNGHYCRGSSRMNISPRNPLAAGAFLCVLSVPLHATLFRHITAETGSPTYAVINSDGSLTESGVTYPCIYKPVPQASWVRTPWISPSQHYVGSHSIGMEIDPSSDPTAPTVDKVNHCLSSGDDSFALTWGVKRYTGFS